MNYQLYYWTGAIVIALFAGITTGLLLTWLWDIIVRIYKRTWLFLAIDVYKVKRDFIKTGKEVPVSIRVLKRMLELYREWPDKSPFKKFYIQFCIDQINLKKTNTAKELAQHGEVSEENDLGCTGISMNY